ncbi:MAG TPA: nucleotidyltransferase family protein, partial [Burkholderiales bacterium]|nr:nucleotidyltransferase family protein [Burkholderiales bacterium]
ASADQCLAIPFVHRHLPGLDRFVPAATRRQIEHAYRVSTARSLQLAALLTGLHERWFAPQAIRYAAVKGTSLGQRYYGDVAARTCRDLDLLVDPASCPATIRYLAEAGFTPCRGFELPADRAKWDRHIAAMCDLNREISLRSPAGDLLDIHSALDLTGGDFPTSRLLGRLEPVSIFGRAIPSLSTADLFVYLCYHHSRHNWTRLHWVADIGKVAASPEFSRDAVFATARRSGMGRLVEACLTMCELLAAASRGEEPTGRGLAATMARQCLAHLVPGAESSLLEYHRRIDDSAFRWRHWFNLTAEEWRHRRGFVRKVRTLLRSSTPSWESYRTLPLPKGLRWLYMPLRTGTHLVRHTPLRWLHARKSKPEASIERAGDQPSSESAIAADT